MRSYINLNTNLRKNATSDFEKDLYKLMNNSVFGKTMENVRNRINVHLVRCGSKENIIRKLIARPSFAKAKIFDHNLAAIHTHKTNAFPAIFFTLSSLLLRSMIPYLTSLYGYAFFTH